MAVKKIKLPNNTTVDINDARAVVIGDGVENVVTLTSAQYQALAVKDAETVYILTDGVPPGGGGGGGGTGEENVIEIVKVNGTALTPDANKAVDVTVPTKVSDLTNDSGFITDSGVVKTSGNQTIAGTKTFSAEVVMTAGGTSDITSGVLCAFKTNRAQITNFATHNILTGGTNSTTPITFYKYTAVSSQAPSSLVQLAKIDTDGNIYEGTTKLSDKYLTSFTETDPVYSASAAAEITSSDISNWNGKTSNVGTITGITMNGSSKGTSGVVNLGTVVTSETDPVFTASAAHGISSTDISNWNAKQKAITVSSSEPTSSQGSNGDIWIVI